MSLLTTPSRPKKNAVKEPTTSTTESAVSEYSNNGDIRATINIPAVTIVAAWINAEIGVGPSIESGSQTCSGAWADLPMAPIKRRMQITDIAFQEMPEKISIFWDEMFSALANTVT